MNGMNFRNSSPINENIDVTRVITVTDPDSTVPAADYPELFQYCRHRN